jgi:hypothetical protein
VLSDQDGVGGDYPKGGTASHRLTIVWCHNRIILEKDKDPQEH